jgi:gas vesicle protein
MMRYDQDANAMNFVAGFLLGAIVGAGIALLTAPEPGNRTRRRIRRVAGELRETATDQLDDFAEDVKARVDDAVRGARKKFVIK